ncbi:MAG: glycosyltransferase [Proteobacteria bacterium]|nr:glycosyltransferase [Pseudomonadota bacterium]MBU1594806.1 glycosyltransferase [Pseudomonadota bacterium]
MIETSALGGWTALPAQARRMLARGSVGRDHLAGLAAGLLPQAAASEAAGRARLARLIQDLLCAAWAGNPLDGGLGQLLSGQPLPQWPRLPEPVADVLKALANFWRPAPDTDPWWSLRDAGERRALLLSRLQAEPKNLFWKAEAWALAWPRADWELADAALLPEAWPRTLAPLRLQASAQALLARGEAQDALAALDGLGAFFPGGSPGLRAECLLRLGRQDEAVDLLTACVLSAPWRSSEFLRLSDLMSGAAGEVAPVPGSVAVLLYTWNKACELDETLASLAASDLQGARIWVLDNGSTDATPQVLEGWRGRLGEALSLVRLPVNIGAPAARNWLLSLPEVRRHEFLVFLDDDVTLPGHWLGRLGAAAVRFPEASVWGCRVVDEHNPLLVQSVDYVPCAPRSQRDASLLLALPTLHLGQPDLGQFTYLRPCVSVTGCCHLLRTADIDATGGFDIRFSPSQYDDLERDLRVFLGGGHVVYQGHLAVRHKRRSGVVAESSPAEIGSAQANARKLEAKHGEAALAGISAGGVALLERDLERRFRLLPG